MSNSMPAEAHMPHLYGFTSAETDAVIAVPRVNDKEWELWPQFINQEALYS